MAFPDWFEPVIIGAGLHKQSLIGASIRHNNPTWEGLLESKRFFGTDARVTSVISLGSRSPGVTAPMTTKTSEANQSEKMKGVEQMIIDCEQTSHRLSGTFANVSAYVRLAIQGSVEDLNIANWDESDNTALNERTNSLTTGTEMDNHLDKAAANLIEESGSVTLGQLSMSLSISINEIII